MGHMTQIANKLHLAVESRQEVADHVQNSHQWQDYFTTRLAPRNEVNPLASLTVARHSLASCCDTCHECVCMSPI